MITKSVRTRFAPSPTGLMHLGSVRTALMNYLFAHQNNGTFILRIEDTDAQRNFDPGGQQIIRDMHWLNLVYDEGPDKEGACGPYRQSERISIYSRYLETLVEKNALYRCFCTEQELERSRERQIALKRPPRYDRTCANLTTENLNDKINNKVPFIWRMKLDHALTFTISDLARGSVRFELKNFPDFPLTRQDGSFTFLFANAVDDIDMKVTHVFRGEDHLSNTALQAALYHAFGADLPTYWHMPIICNSEGKKLSKRDFGFSLNDLQNAGYLPEAICNYLGIIGSGTFEEEIASLDDLVRMVRFTTMTTTGLVRYDVEKLRWVNHKWMSKYDAQHLAQLCLPFIRAVYPEVDTLDQTLLINLLQTVKTDLVTLADAPQALHFYFKAPTLTMGDIIEKIGDQATLARSCVVEHLDLLETKDLFVERVKASAKQHGLPIKHVFWFIRLALTGQQDGPSIHDLIAMLGTTTARERITRLGC